MADWYVSPSGNDTTGDGSTGNPWKHVHKAIDESSSGDTIICKDGTYDEGTSGHYIYHNLTIRSESADFTTVIINWQGDYGMWYVRSANIVFKVYDITLTASTYGYIITFYNDTIDYVDIYFVRCFFRDTTSQYAIIRNSKSGSRHHEIFLYKCTFRNIQKYGSPSYHGIVSCYYMTVIARDCIFVNCNRIIHSSAGITWNDDYNCYYDIDDMTGVSVGANSIEVDPLFTEAGVATIESNSPCVDDGVIITDYVESYEGDAPDMGCYEYVSAGVDVIVTPTVLTLTNTILSPTIIEGTGITVTPTVLTLTTSVLAPTIVAQVSVIVQPSVLVLTASVLSPIIFTGVNIVVQPSVLTLTSTALSPTIIAVQKIESSFNFASRLLETVSSSFTFLSRLWKEISSSFNLGAYLYTVFTLKARLYKRIVDNFQVLSTLWKTQSSNFNLTSFIKLLVRSYKRSYLQFKLEGNILIGANQDIPVNSAGPAILQKIFVYCKTLGGSGHVLLDINKNGATIFTSQDKRPEILHDDVNKWVEVVPNIKSVADGDVFSLDVDDTDIGFENISVVLVFEDIIDINPNIKEFDLLDDEFVMNLKGGDVGWITDKFRIKFIFNVTMNVSYTPVAEIIPLSSQSIFTMGTGHWETTYVAYDTWISDEIVLISDNIGSFLLSITNAKSYFAYDLKKNMRIKLEKKNLVYSVTPYTLTGNIDLKFLVRTAQHFSFSLDNSLWSAVETFKLEKTLDITDASIGGNSLEGAKTIYIKFTQGSITYTSTYVVYYYTSEMDSFDYYSTIESKYDSATVHYKYSPSLVDIPLKEIKIFINDVLFATYLPKSKVVSGLDIKTVDDDNLKITLNSGIISVKGKGYEIAETELEFDVSGEETRIDLIYWDAATNTLKIKKGVEGQVSAELPYVIQNDVVNYYGNEDFLSQYLEFPAAPSYTEGDEIPLHYIYISISVDNMEGDTPENPLVSTLFIHFQPAYFYDFVDIQHFNSVIIGEDNLNSVILNHVKIKQIDVAGREKDEIEYVSLSVRQRTGRIKGYLDEMLVQEIQSGDVVRQDTIWLSLK